MNSQIHSRSDQREFVTEVLAEDRWPETLEVIVRFLESKGVEKVWVEFGFVVQRDLQGEQVPEDRIVAVRELAATFERGFQEGTIEWAGTSDLVFSAIGTDLLFKLCNDADLHFSSANAALMAELSRLLSNSGTKVYE